MDNKGIEVVKRVLPWAGTAAIALAMGGITLEQHPGTTAVNGQSTIEPKDQSGKTITRPHSAVEIQVDQLNKRYMIDVATGAITPVEDPKDIFANYEQNSGVYFCKDAPKGQADLRQELTTNPYVIQRLRAMGINPNNAYIRFLSDQPVLLSQSKALYMQAGFSESEAEKLADPKAQVSPFQVGGQLKSAAVSFLSDEVAKSTIEPKTGKSLYDLMKADPALYERQGKYLESDRLIWPIVFSKTPVTGMIQVGGTSLQTMDIALTLPQEIASTLRLMGDDDKPVAANVDATCCQPLKPGQPEQPAQPEQPEQPGQPTPTSTATEETPEQPAQPAKPAVPAPKPATPEITFPTCLGVLTLSQFEHELNLRGSSLSAYQSLQEAANALARAACVVPTTAPTTGKSHPNNGGSSPQNSPTPPGTTPETTPESTPESTPNVPVPPTLAPLQPTGVVPTPPETNQTATPIPPHTPVTTATPARPGTPTPPPPTLAPVEPTGAVPTPPVTTRTNTPIPAHTPDATATPARQPSPVPSPEPVPVPPTAAPLEPTKAVPTPLVKPTDAPIAPHTPVVPPTAVRQPGVTPAAAPTSGSGVPAAPTPAR